jgi:branched-chain amino acid transport system permease protein
MVWVNAIVQGTLLGGLYALFACGLSLVFGVMRVVNLAHGDLAVVAAFLAFSLLGPASGHIAVAFVVVIPLFAALGYALHRGLLQRSLDVGPLSTLLATFGLSVVIQNVLLQVYSADTHALDAGALTSGSIRVNAQISVSTLALLTFALAVVVLVGVQVFLSRTPLGRMMRASADDPGAASMSGGDVKHVYATAMAIAFGTIALAGLLFGMRSSFDPSIGPTRLIFAFEAVVIGGLGSLWGTLLGGVVLGLAQTVFAQIDPAWTLLGGHLIFLAVLAFRPQGLIPARSTA